MRRTQVNRAGDIVVAQGCSIHTIQSSIADEVGGLNQNQSHLRHFNQSIQLRNNPVDML